MKEIKFKEVPLRVARAIVGIKQIELAKKSGVIQSRISFAENGIIELRPEEKEAIEKVLGMKIKWEK